MQWDAGMTWCMQYSPNLSMIQTNQSREPCHPVANALDLEVSLLCCHSGLSVTWDWNERFAHAFGTPSDCTLFTRGCRSLLVMSCMLPENWN